MRVVLAAIGGLVVGALGAGGWLWRDNQELEDRARRAEAAAATAAEAEEAEAAPSQETAEGPSRRRGRDGDGSRLLGAIGRAMQAGGDAPEPTASASDDWRSRRERRQARLKETLGRREGESDQAYKDRVVPLVQTMLMIPRGRLADRRREFEDAAGVTEEQREKLDGLVKDTQAELIALANQAVASGQLTPYRRNTAGLAGFVGGAATIAEGADQKLRQLLSKEQLAEMEASGFDFIEYLAVSSPWETVNPPPADAN
jgi:hypothetical protein